MYNSWLNLFAAAFIFKTFLKENRMRHFYYNVMWCHVVIISLAFFLFFLRNMRLDLIGLLRGVLVTRMRTRVHKRGRYISSCLTAESARACVYCCLATHTTRSDFRVSLVIVRNIFTEKCFFAIHVGRTLGSLHCIYTVRFDYMCYVTEVCCFLWCLCIDDRYNKCFIWWCSHS